jgi:hypothetical protein
VDRGRGYIRLVFFGSLALILVLAAVLMVCGYPARARGLILGGAASLVNLLLTAAAVRGQVWGSSGKGFRFGAAGAYAARMGITAAALIFGALDVRVSFWAVVIGLFAVQMVLVAGTLTGLTERKD